MPVVRVPVVHRFGIVSVSRAEQLLREGQRNNTDEHPTTSRPVVKNTAPTKISQSFIEKYNKASDTERGKLDRIVQRTFLQAKYKAGLHRSQGGGVRGGTREQQQGDEGRVCDAWLELILLCQCYGPHQEDVLLVLALSLNHAPLSSIHIPSLLYMCGLCYQWLKSDVSVSHTTGQLRTGELLLLRILYLISLRLYYHQIAGTLKDVCTREDIRQLKFDLQGFESRECVYRNFPEALLHWKVALEVGQVVVERNSPVVVRDPTDPSTLSPLHPSPSKPSSSQNTSTVGEEERGGGGREVGGEGRGVFPVLRDSLEIWRAVRGGGRLEQAIGRLAASPAEFTVDNWMESLLGINILCLGSQLSLPVLTLLHSLTTSPSTTSHPPHTSLPHHYHTSDTPSLLQDTPTEGSQISMETSPIRDDHLHNPLPAKKGTRFILPGATDTNAGSTGGQMTPDSPDTMPGKHRRHVDTLNVLGQQPGFREPYPESLCSEPPGAGLEETSSLLRALPPARPSVASQERADLVSYESLDLAGTTAGSRLDTHTQSHSQELGSGSTLEKSSLSQSLIITSSPWLKSSTSKNIEWSPDVTQWDTPLLQGAHRLAEESKSVVAYGSPIGDKLDGLASTLGESLSSVLGDQTPEPVSGQSVMLSAFPRNVETRCTHYTHSSSALSDGAGVPGSHVAPSTIYRQSVYSPQLTVDVGIEESDGGETGEKCGGDVSGGGLVTVARAGRAGFVRWPSEVGLAYTLGMGEVVLYGRTSRIQSAALEGGTGERVLGLRQLAEFSTNTHASLSKESGTCAVNIMRFV
jgi:hypothetical protein